MHFILILFFASEIVPFFARYDKKHTHNNPISQQVPRNICLSSNSYQQRRRFSAKSLWAQFSRKKISSINFYDYYSRRWERDSAASEKNMKKTSKIKSEIHMEMELLLSEWKLIFCKAFFCVFTISISKSWEKFFCLINDQVVLKKTQLSTTTSMREACAFFNNNNNLMKSFNNFFRFSVPAEIFQKKTFLCGFARKKIRKILVLSSKVGICLLIFENAWKSKNGSKLFFSKI